MTMFDGFHPVTEVAADERARVAVGKAGAHARDRYAVSTNADGAILLTPLASIPRRELLVWEDGDVRASVFRGLADAVDGNVRPLGWVTADGGLEEE